MQSSCGMYIVLDNTLNTMILILVIVFWTDTDVPSRSGTWTQNHFVPLLRRKQSEMVSVPDNESTMKNQDHEIDTTPERQVPLFKRYPVQSFVSLLSE